MDHSHEGHDHAPSNLDHITRAFYIGIGLNTLFTIIEFVLGYAYNSLALLADASHNLSDVASLIIALIALKLSQMAATLCYTYGYRKASILASFINSVILIIVVIGIIKEAIERLYHVPEVVGEVIIITALIGVVINTISAFLFFKGQKDDINVRGAFLHLIVDAIVSLGVVISGIIIYYTHLNIIDPIISIIIAIVIIITTWGLFKESLKLILAGVPTGIHTDKITNMITNIGGVKDVYHVHIWAISSTINAFSGHIILENTENMTEWIKIKDKIKQELEGFDIQHVTLELDTKKSNCRDFGCE